MQKGVLAGNLLLSDELGKVKLLHEPTLQAVLDRKRRLFDQPLQTDHLLLAPGEG